MYNLTENYLTNVDEVLTLAKKYDHLFRLKGKDGEPFATEYGDASLKQFQYYNMPQDMVDAIFKTIPDRYTDRLTFCINKYEAGDHIPRHKDSMGLYWKFKCIFLTNGNPHFKYWDEDDNEHLVQEKAGALFNMKLGTPHAVTEIQEGEESKYSLCIMQGLDTNVRVEFESRRKVA